MAADTQQGGIPTVLRTDRLVLCLADPSNPSHCKEIIRIYTDSRSAPGGPGKTALRTVADVQKRHNLHGPKTQFCTLAAPPKGMYFLIYLPEPNNGEQGAKDVLTGTTILSFRPEIPYPDLGWALFGPYQGLGYATEAGRAALGFWRDVVGVKQICAMTIADNIKSQRCAERIGFVMSGTLDIAFGEPPNESRLKGRALVLPGMKWEDDIVLRPEIGTE